MSIDSRIERALDDDFLALMEEHYRPADLTRFHRELSITVDRERARFAAWYELFPRSQVSPERGSSRVTARSPTPRPALPRLASLGFDVVYLAPIHPIGRTFRKGKNNSLTPEPDDVGSPWAIGNENGGHTAIEPALGTIDDFDRFVQIGARPRHRRRARLRAAMLARPSVGARASRLVLHPSRRDDQVRRESAEEVSGHLSAELLVRRPRGICGTRAATSCCSGSSTA